MVLVEISYRNFNTFSAVLIYLEYYFTKHQIPHRRCLYSFEDKWKNMCADVKADVIATPLYILDPMVPEYVFTWRSTEFTVRVKNLEGNHLYKSIDNPGVFEPVFSMEIEIADPSSTQPIDDLILRSLQYVSRWDNQNTSHRDIVVYHWCDDFWDKLHTVEKRDIQTIYLPQGQRDDVLKDLNRFLSADTKKLYSEFGIPYHRTYCLHGPPGTGKSSLIMSLVSECQKNVGVLSLSRKTDDLSFVRAVNTIPKNTVLLLEDIDCLLGERNDKTSQVTFSALLNLLDGVQSRNGLVIFITTNYFMKLDPAFCRPGRIDYVLGFQFTTRSQIFQMLEKFFPSQQADFETFYQEVKHTRLTTCILQKYLFQKYPDKSILEDIQNIKKDAAINDHHDSMYI